MKRKWVPVLAGVLACSFLLAGCQGTDKDDGEDEANEPKPEAVMEVADAKLSEGGLDGYTEMPEYDKDNDAVTNLLPGQAWNTQFPQVSMVHTIFILKSERPVYCPVKQCLM